VTRELWFKMGVLFYSSFLINNDAFVCVVFQRSLFKKYDRHVTEFYRRAAIENEKKTVNLFQQQRLCGFIEANLYLGNHLCFKQFFARYD